MFNIEFGGFDFVAAVEVKAARRTMEFFGSKRDVNRLFASFRIVFVRDFFMNGDTGNKRAGFTCRADDTPVRNRAVNCDLAR
jgi:hypothetical protein